MLLNGIICDDISLSRTKQAKGEEDVYAKVSKPNPLQKVSNHDQSYTAIYTSSVFHMYREKNICSDILLNAVTINGPIIYSIRSSVLFEAFISPRWSCGLKYRKLSGVGSTTNLFLILSSGWLS